MEGCCFYVSQEYEQKAGEILKSVKIFQALVKVTSLRGCPLGKIRTRASFTKILANYISEESLIHTDYDKNIT